MTLKEQLQAERRLLHRELLNGSDKDGTRVLLTVNALVLEKLAGFSPKKVQS